MCKLREHVTQIEHEQSLLIFSSTTQVIKMWARAKGLYSFNGCYLNGISLMIMVVRTMQETQFSPDKSLESTVD